MSRIKIGYREVECPAMLEGLEFAPNGAQSYFYKPDGNAENDVVVEIADLVQGLAAMEGMFSNFVSDVLVSEATFRQQISELVQYCKAVEKEPFYRSVQRRLQHQILSEEVRQMIVEDE